MPRGDGTGPMGQGPMTRRGKGSCSSGARRGLGLAIGTGMGLGLGLRRGFRNLLKLNLKPEEEISELKEQVTILEKNLSKLKDRINEIEKEK
jgi:hypothetical protein